MRTKTKAAFILLFFTFVSFANADATISIQDTKTVEGVFEGKEDYGYNFMATRDDGSEFTITFHNVNEEVLGQFDLSSGEMIDKKFKITYQIKIKKTKDEHGFEDEEEILTITNLEAI